MTDVEDGFAHVAKLLDRWQLDEAARALADVEAVADGPARAVVTVLRARLQDARDEPFDVPGLVTALDEFLAGGRWQLAYDACNLLAAAHPGDLGAARRFRTIAIGCAEAGCALRLGATQLRLLAAAELAAGDHGRCLAHLDQALRRLEGVLLVGARFEEACCHELAGDAEAAAGATQAAREQYDRARERFKHAEFGAAHRARVEAKRAALDR